ncbi:MAG: MBL fold metallo-hydrolase, partial [Gemmatimonadetes bacterium]|nr:MBL fold metallo-hydrolase [Gemmatimonadota bacterium]
MTADPSDLRVHTATAGAFAENGYVVESVSTGRAWIVDPGACAPQLVATVRSGDCTLESVLLTHAHIDHVEGLHAVRAAFPDAPILLHDDDLPLYREAAAQASWFGLELDPLPEPGGRLEAGGTLAWGPHEVEIRHAPGHAPGHVVFIAHDAGLALVGDVIFLGSIGRTDL